MSAIKYEWLTHKQAVAELETGREVVQVNSYSGNWLYTDLNWFKAQPNAGNESKWRKPLMPEQIIKAGTPLLAKLRHENAWILLYKISEDLDLDYFLTNGLGQVYRSNQVKFTTNKNGNYLTINKNSEWSEALR